MEAGEPLDERAPLEAPRRNDRASTVERALAGISAVHEWLHYPNHLMQAISIDPHESLAGAAGHLDAHAEVCRVGPVRFYRLPHQGFERMHFQVKLHLARGDLFDVENIVACPPTASMAERAFPGVRPC
jgi:hypothetical protein